MYCVVLDFLGEILLNPYGNMYCYVVMTSVVMTRDADNSFH